MASNSLAPGGLDFKPRRRGHWKKILASALALPACLGFYGLRWFEYAVTFRPEPYSSNQPWETPAGGEDVWFVTRDNVRLHGWFVNSQTKPALATVIFFHGNGGNLGHVGWLGEALARRGFDVLLFDYRGYGRSGGEMRDENDLYADADAAYDFAVGARGAQPDRIVLYGQSLGTTAVADLASRRKCGALIVESGLSSASDMAATMLPWLPRPLRALGRNRFESARKLASVHSPVLIVHGDPDHTVPTDNARRLYAAANEPKRLMIVAGADHNVFGTGGDRYLDEVAAFIRAALSKAGAI
ncbi:MAG: alpha/beta hydrolase [Pyrinomonadaceae bacterium]